MAYSNIPNDMGFVRPGIVTVDKTALDLARQVAKKVGTTWITTFSWATARSIRAHRDAPETHLGAGLGIGGFRRHEVPRAFIHESDGFEFAIQIPHDVLDRSKEKRIVLDQFEFERVKLL